MVWAALLSADVLKQCIPGCRELTGSSSEGFSAIVVQKVGPIKATFKGKVPNTWLWGTLVTSRPWAGLLTICPEDQRCRWALNLALCDAVHHHTSVVAHVWGVHLGDVKISRLLGDETPIVLLNKVRVLIEDPCIRKVWKKKRFLNVMVKRWINVGNGILYSTSHFNFKQLHSLKPGWRFTSWGSGRSTK